MPMKLGMFKWLVKLNQVREQEGNFLFGLGGKL